jgi:hypothetical protein
MDGDILAIPDYTTEIKFENVSFYSFPALPSSIKKIRFTCCIAAEDLVVTLHEGLESLCITGCIAEVIREFPSTLKHLEYRKGGTGRLPPLPSGLESLSLYRDKFTRYPSCFPSSLKVLDLCESRWTSLPAFPESFEKLILWGMKMDYIPPYPASFVEDDLYIYNTVVCETCERYDCTDLCHCNGPYMVFNMEEDPIPIPY